MYMHKCPNCSKYFISKEEKLDQFCWRCGQGMQIDIYTGFDAKDRIHNVAMRVLFNKFLES